MLTRILSIDGGGIKGIIPGTILAHLEEKIQQATGNNADRIADYFDLIAGTSTGGILTCLLLCPDNSNRPKYTAKEAVDFYLKKGDSIFSSDIWKRIKTMNGLLDEKYSATELENGFVEFFGDTKLSQLIKPCLITAYDIEYSKTVFFNSMDLKKHPDNDFLVRDVARATSAAPTYFEVSRISSNNGTYYPLIDGGIFANNPAMCAFAEATKLQNDFSIQNTFILSLGTGADRKNAQSIPYKKAKDWGIAEWVKPLITILMKSSAETVHYQLNSIFQNAGKAENYIRVEPSLVTADPVMDNATPSNMEALYQDAKHFIEQNEDKFTTIVEKILNNPEKK